jgi:hypothetical protein
MITGIQDYAFYSFRGENRGKRTKNLIIVIIFTINRIVDQLKTFIGYNRII